VGVGIFQHPDPAAARYSAGRQPALLEWFLKEIFTGMHKHLFMEHGPDRFR